MSTNTRFKITAATLLRPASLAVLLCGFFAVPAAAQLITLSPANVIGSSPSSDGGTTTYNWDSGSSPYRASTIFSQQTGNVSGSAGTWTNNTWFPAASIGGEYASLNNRYVVIDLGAAYFLSSFELFNGTATYQHTGTFDILASNSITTAADEGGFTRGQTLSSPITLLGSTSLTYANTESVTGQTFSVSNTTAYRYIQIDLLTAAGSENPPGTMDIRGSSFSEVRISGSLTAIPEPSTYAVLAGAAMLGVAVWRRRCRKDQPAVATN